MPIDKMIYTAKREYPVEVGGMVWVYEYWHLSGKLMQECVPQMDEYNNQRLLECRDWRLVGWGDVISDQGLQVNVFHDWHERIIEASWTRERETPPNKFKTLRYIVGSRVWRVQNFIEWYWNYFRLVTLRRK